MRGQPKEWLKSNFMYDIALCTPEEKFGFAELILFSSIKNRIKEISSDNELIQNQNFNGIFLLKEFKIEPKIINLISKKKKSIFLIDFSCIYNSRSFRRGILLSQIKEFLKYCIKYNMKYSFANFADKKEDVRNPIEIIGICSLLELNEIEAKQGICEIKKYL